MSHLLLFALAFGRRRPVEICSSDDPQCTSPHVRAVNCGRHHAVNCRLCPKVYGITGCSGDCVWRSRRRWGGTCEPRTKLPHVAAPVVEPVRVPVPLPANGIEDDGPSECRTRGARTILDPRVLLRHACGSGAWLNPAATNTGYCAKQRDNSCTCSDFDEAPRQKWGVKYVNWMRSLRRSTHERRRMLEAHLLHIGARREAGNYARPTLVLLKFNSGFS